MSELLTFTQPLAKIPVAGGPELPTVSKPSVSVVSWPYPVSVENAPTTTLNNPKTKFFRIIRAPVYHSRPEILAPQFTLARFNRSLAGLRPSTDPELPGALQSSLVCPFGACDLFLFHVSLRRRAPRRSPSVCPV